MHWEHTATKTERSFQATILLLTIYMEAITNPSARRVSHLAHKDYLAESETVRTLETRSLQCIRAFKVDVLKKLGDEKPCKGLPCAQ